MQEAARWLHGGFVECAHSSPGRPLTTLPLRGPATCLVPAKNGISSLAEALDRRLSFKLARAPLGTGRDRRHDQGGLAAPRREPALAAGAHSAEIGRSSYLHGVRSGGKPCLPLAPRHHRHDLVLHGLKPVPSCLTRARLKLTPSSTDEMPFFASVDDQVRWRRTTELSAGSLVAWKIVPAVG